MSEAKRNPHLSRTPDRDFTGTDTVTYTVDDGSGGTATGTITVTVTPPGSPPIARDDIATTEQDGSVIIPVLANDIDPDGDPLTLSSASATSGAVTINPDGTLAYTPAPGFVGTDTITYRVSDGVGGLATATVTVTVYEAGKDVGFLIGDARPDATPANPPVAIDPLLPVADEPARVGTIISETVNGVRSLNSITPLDVERPLIDAINDFGSLKGIGELGGGRPVILQVVEWLKQNRDLRSEMDRLFDRRFGDAPAALSGFSVRQLSTGTSDVMIESSSQGQILYLEMRDVGPDGASRIARYELRTEDGTALPDWVRVDQRGFVLIERPIGVEELHLIVRAVREDGSRVDIPIVINGETGAVRLDGEAHEITARRGATLGETLAAATHARAEEQMLLAQAFGSDGH